MQFYRQDMQAKISRIKFGKIFIHLPGDSALTDCLGSQPRIKHNWSSAQGSYLTSSFPTQRFSNVKTVLRWNSSLWMSVFHYPGEWSKPIEDHQMGTSEARCWGHFTILLVWISVRCHYSSLSRADSGFVPSQWEMALLCKWRFSLAGHKPRISLAYPIFSDSLM